MFHSLQISSFLTIEIEGAEDCTITFGQFRETRNRWRPAFRGLQPPADSGVRDGSVLIKDSAPAGPGGGISRITCGKRR